MKWFFSVSIVLSLGLTSLFGATIEPGDSSKRHKTDYVTNWNANEAQTYTVSAYASGCSFVDSKTKANGEATLKSHSSSGASAEKSISHTDSPTTEGFGFSVSGVLAGSGNGNEVSWSATLEQRFFWLEASPAELVQAGKAVTITAKGSAPTESTWSINSTVWKDHTTANNNPYKSSSVILSRNMWDKMKWTPSPVPTGYLFPSVGNYTISATTTETDNVRSANIVVRIIDVEFVTPTGDPVNDPTKNNEFVYSSRAIAAGGSVMTINLEAKIVPADAATKIKGDCVFEMPDIAGSTKTWAATNANGKAIVTGDKLTATITYTGLPTQNASFGKKTAKITCNVEGIALNKTTEFEVFFPRDATNHPACAKCPGCPNWFYYWGQVYLANVYYVSTADVLGEVPAMTSWSYSVLRDKTRINIGNQNPGKGKSYGIGKEMSGIDLFVSTIIHENKHIDQITRADTLLPTNRNDSFRYGWSWNVATHNHWTKGPDGKWGIANVDDDGNGTIDDAKPLPPFEPGNGDDVNLSDARWVNKPAVWDWIVTPPYSTIASPIEREAIKAADDAINENDYARSDWGAPGKNKTTINKWDD